MVATCGRLTHDGGSHLCLAKTHHLYIIYVYILLSTSHSYMYVVGINSSHLILNNNNNNNCCYRTNISNLEALASKLRSPSCKSGTNIWMETEIYMLVPLEAKSSSTCCIWLTNLSKIQTRAIYYWIWVCRSCWVLENEEVEKSIQGWTLFQ